LEISKTLLNAIAAAARTGFNIPAAATGIRIILFGSYLSLSFASFFYIFDLKKWIFRTLARIRDTLQEEMAFSRNIKRIREISIK